MVHRAVALAATAVATTTACGSDWQDQPIHQVTVSDDDRTLDVGWHCHNDVDVDVLESATEVRLTLHVNGYRGDCADTARVVLNAPIDDRPLIDATTGRNIRTCTAATGPKEAAAECA